MSTREKHLARIDWVRSRINVSTDPAERERLRRVLKNLEEAFEVDHAE